MDSDLTDDSDANLFTDDETSDESVAEQLFEEVDDEPVNQEEPEWHIVQEGADARPRPLPEFYGFAGVRPDIQLPQTADGNEEAFMKLFLTDQLFEGLSSWTNAKAWKLYEECETQDDVPKLVLNWKNCTADEVRKLVGIILLMGLDKKPELSSYWSSDPVFHCAFLAQPCSLSRDRFKQMLSCLRFYDCADALAAGPLAKMQPFLKQVKELCNNIFVPRQQLSIDETLVLYKGRVLFKQYIPTKKNKYGIKMYCLCEADTTYLWNFVIHTTNEANQQFGEGLGCQDLSISERVVAELCRPLLYLGHHLFMDSWFTSQRLATWLLQRGTLLTGTVRKNRGIPAVLQAVPLHPTSAAFARSGDILACKFVDRRQSGTKTVFLLDTAGKAECRDIQRTRRGGGVQVVAKPASVLAYTASMGGVDQMDAALHPYLANRKSLRWFHKLGFHLLLMLVRNAWIVYQQSGGSKTFLLFLRQAIKSLVQDTGNARRRGVTPGAAGAAAAGAVGAHSPSKAPSQGAQPRPRKRCRVCYAGGRTKRTIFVCEVCPGMPALCIGACFSSWHQN